MLKLLVPALEEYNEELNEYRYTKPYELQLEHSLVSISKWESKWKKPFLSTPKKTDREMRDYIRCMTITQNIPPMVYSSMPKELILRAEAYMHDSMTATTIKKGHQPGARNTIVTSELIYYWMVQYNIPINPCEKWHINRLLTLIDICNQKGVKPTKMSEREIAAQMKAVNDARRAKYHTKG